MKCYYCDGEHCINEHEKFKKDQVKYNLSRANIARKYKERILKNVKKSNISINEAALLNKCQESTYSIEHAEQLIGAMQLSKTDSDSDSLDEFIQYVTIDKVNSDTPIVI